MLSAFSLLAKVGIDDRELLASFDITCGNEIKVATNAEIGFRTGIRLIDVLANREDIEALGRPQQPSTTNSKVVV